jgi:hypothetical protein
LPTSNLVTRTTNGPPKDLICNTAMSGRTPSWPSLARWIYCHCYLNEIIIFSLCHSLAAVRKCHRIVNPFIGWLDWRRASILAKELVNGPHPCLTLNVEMQGLSLPLTSPQGPKLTKLRLVLTPCRQRPVWPFMASEHQSLSDDAAKNVWTERSVCGPHGPLLRGMTPFNIEEGEECYAMGCCRLRG